jgi:hypothetical protein
MRGLRWMTRLTCYSTRAQHIDNTYRLVITLMLGRVFALRNLSPEKVDIEAFVVLGHSSKLLVQPRIIKDAKRQVVCGGDDPRIPRIDRVSANLENRSQILRGTARDDDAV